MYLLGFVHKSSIRREWYLNNTQIVVPIPNDLASQVHIAALTKALFAESRYALVRMIHHKRIKYGILIPVEQKPEDEGEQVKHKLRFIQMPFAEDVREYQFSNLQLVGGDNKRMRKGIKQGLTVDVIMDKTKNFIDALDVDSHMKADEVYVPTCDFFPRRVLTAKPVSHTRHSTHLIHTLRECRSAFDVEQHSPTKQWLPFQMKSRK